MIKNTIFILTLNLLFLVSTTGLPVTYHLCQMMGQKSLYECNVCKAEMEIIGPSCCGEEMMEYPVTISSDNPICCQDEFVYNKVEDDFSQSINLNTITNSVITILKPLVPGTESEEKYSHQNNYSLPPPKFGKQLLHSIHQLKINFSNC